MLGTLRPLLASLPKTASQMEKVVARAARSLGGWLLGWAMDQHIDNPLFVSPNLFLYTYLFMYCVLFI